MRTLETRTEAILWGTVVLAGVGWGLLASQWTIDWVTAPHHRGVVAKCVAFYEQPLEYGNPRKCYSDTGEGRRYIYGAGQGDVGEKFSFIYAHHLRQTWGPGATAFAPTPMDWAYAVGALVLIGVGLRGWVVLGWLAEQRRRYRRAVLGGLPVCMPASRH